MTHIRQSLITRLILFDEVTYLLGVFVIRDYHSLGTIENSLDNDEQAAVPSHRRRPHGHVSSEVVDLDVSHVIDHGRVADLGTFRKAARTGRANDRGNMIGTGQLRALEFVDPRGVLRTQNVCQRRVLESRQFAKHHQLGI